MLDVIKMKQLHLFVRNASKVLFECIFLVYKDIIEDKLHFLTIGVALVRADPKFYVFVLVERARII